MTLFDPAFVAAARLPKPDYPAVPPFHPHSRYPEYEGSVGNETNWVYESVRECLLRLGMDAAHYSSPLWNPL